VSGAFRSRRVGGPRRHQRRTASRNCRAAASDALFSSVNLGEVVTKLAEKGFGPSEIGAIVGVLDCEIVPFDAAQALDVGLLRPPTKPHGLSFGDRACLALAMRRELPVYTAERSWAQVDVGVDIV